MALPVSGTGLNTLYILNPTAYPLPTANIVSGSFYPGLKLAGLGHSVMTVTVAVFHRDLLHPK